MASNLGVDFEKAKEMGIKTIWALSLPGKVAPVTAAGFIRDTVYNIIDELGYKKMLLDGIKIDLHSQVPFVL